MLATASWIRRHLVELGWAVFAAANLGVMAWLAGHDGGTVPFHFIWVSLTLLYGFTVWRLWPTLVVLSAVMISTGGMILLEIASGPTRPDELTEVPLMAAMFVAMAWHARRRVAAETRMLESQDRERNFLRESSHHLKTPLGIARGFAELVGSGGLDERQDQDLEVLIGELDHMQRLVDGLLVYNSSQPDSIDRRDVDLGQLLGEVTERWMTAVERRWDVRVEGAGIISADEERVRYAFDALLENAVEATEPDDPISVVAQTEGGAATIWIADGGRGIPPESIGHVFDRFWSSGPNQSRKSGLGLAIVRSVVEAHHGSVRVESAGRGATFTIRLGAGETSNNRPQPAPPRPLTARS
jgi:signal transduction histidine kinase